MSSEELHHVMERGHPLNEAEMAETQYLGVDLSLPPLATRLLWKTFRKAFHRDQQTSVLRGWNVRLEQHGVKGPRTPMTGRDGQPLSFGHYHVRSAAGVRFPKAWRGAQFLDYTVAGNRFADPARFAQTPLVAVNAGSSELLLGWEVFRLGPTFLPLPLYWALVKDGPLDRVEPVPRPGTVQPRG